MKKYFVALFVSAGVLLGTVGCATQDPATGEAGRTTLYEQSVELRDGRIVSCVARISGYAGGLSCDWDNAK